MMRNYLMMRLSPGSAARLGLLDIKQIAQPTTCYMMIGERCLNGCAFCAQSVCAEGLSRLRWAEFPEEQIIRRLNESHFSRACLQCTSAGIGEILEVIGRIRIPKVSVCYNFTDMQQVEKVADRADRICISLDCADAEIFSRLKKGDFSARLDLLKCAAARYPGRITTHLIAGLGESEYDMRLLLEELYANGIRVGLFAFTPVKGTVLEDMKQPDIGYYRKLQAIHHRIWQKTECIPAEAFETSGCDLCNRPYYNETPGGAIYNYPRELTDEEYRRCLDELAAYDKQ